MSERVSGRARRAVGLLVLVAVLIFLLVMWSLYTTDRGEILSIAEVGLSVRVGT